MTTDLKPIRTTFNGIVYRSRLEANVAQMLHQLDIRAEYETASFLLDDGTHYRPDFWCPEIKLWIEVRGYSNQLGDRQIRQFGNAIMAGRLRADKILLPDPARSPLNPCGHPKAEGCPADCLMDEPVWRGDGSVDYLVLSPGGASRFFEVPSYHTCEGRDTEVLVCICGACDRAYFASRHNDWRCRSCGASHMRYHLLAWDRMYLDDFGRPVVRCEWYDRGLNKVTTADLSVPAWLERVRAPQ